MDTINDVGWEQMVMEPTRGSNTLDLFLTNHPNLVPRTETLPGIADHDTVYMEMLSYPPKKRQPQRSIPIYTEECKEPLKEAVQRISERIISTFDEMSSAEEVWTEMRSSLNQALSDHVPHKRTRPKPSLPWIDYETKKLIRRRDRVHKRIKKSGDETLKQEFKALKRLFQKRLRHAYWRYAEGLMSDDGENQTTPKKKFWSFIKARRTEAVGVSPLKEAGKLISEPKEQARIMNTQFHSVFSPKDTITAEEFELRCPPGPYLPEYPLCGDISITEDGVRKLLLSLNPNKACGPDGITPRLLKMVAEELTPALTVLYRISYFSGTLPKDWKQAKITPVFKKGENTMQLNTVPSPLPA